MVGAAWSKGRNSALGALGVLIALLLCAPATYAEGAAPDTPAVDAATRLLLARGVDVATHALERDNLAYYLVQGANVKKVGKLLASTAAPADASVLELVATRRWKAKVGRSLASAGTDGQVRERLLTVSRAFHEFSALAAKVSPGATFRFILSGSLVKGHFGAGSDIDVIVDTKDERLARWAMSSPWSTNAVHPEGYDEVLAVADAGDYSHLSKRVNLRLLGQTLAVPGEVHAEGFLVDLYVRLLGLRGVALDPATFAPAYEPDNYLCSMRRELPLALVRAIDEAKDLREAVAAWTSHGGDAAEAEAPMAPEDLERLERAARVQGRMGSAPR